MQTDTYGQIIFDEKDLVDLYLHDPNKVLKNVLVSEPINYNSDLDLTNIPSTKIYENLSISVEEFDDKNQSSWNFPDSYKEMDIAKYILDQCKNDEELQRAGKELLLYQEKDMFMLLKYLKYLVDIMRENNIVWGVGRGSSVASFVLFLLGVHKINSLYYDLEIEEFLK
jgi:DNA polymerase III alpha subunit